MLSVRNITKSFANLKVLDNLSVDLQAGEFVSLLGPSGSGKSTLFRIITGLMVPDTGHIKQTGKIAYMPQRDLLLPWKKLIDNIALPLVIAGISKHEARQRVLELLPVFSLEGFEQYYPHQLSGGMRQRAALMRTVLVESPILLMDEPFAALDALTREQMQEWLLDIWVEFNPAIFFITHSVDEAIFLSDRIYLLSSRPGKVILNLEIDLPRPRKRNVVLTEKFLSYKKVFLDGLAKGEHL